MKFYSNMLIAFSQEKQHNSYFQQEIILERYHVNFTSQMYCTLILN